jgi:hypothetical protein
VKWKHFFKIIFLKFLRLNIQKVPIDTKLSKLDTLKLASTYIAHLTSVLQQDNEKTTNNSDTTYSTSNYHQSTANAYAIQNNNYDIKLNHEFQTTIEFNQTFSA